MSTPAPNRFNGRFYPLDQFDRSLCLKPPVGLLLCLLVICRDLVFALISTTSTLKGRGLDMSSLVAQHHRWIFLAGLVPAMLVLAAWVQRTPTGGAVVRWLWKHGAWLLSASALIQSVPALLALFRGDFFTAAIHESPVMLLVTGVMIAYLLRSTRVKDAFADFPQANGI